MAQVVKNPDNTLTVTLNAKEQKLLKRWGDEQLPPRNVGAQFEDVVNGFLQNKANDYRNIDGPTLRDKYEALTPAKQAEVDAILNAP